MVDLIILGGGPAGYLAAERAATAGLSVILFEKRALGGVCLNEGCIPSKALLYSAKIFDYAKGGGEKYGVVCQNPVLDYAKAVRRKNKVVKTLAAGVAAKLKHAKAEVISAEAVVKGRVAGGYEVTANGETYAATHLLLATGSSPILPPIDGLMEALAGGFALTNQEILNLTAVPKRLAIMGGGVIGLEMASLFNSAGAEVTVIEMLHKIAGPTDNDIAAALQKNYEKKGVTFVLGAKVTKFTGHSLLYEKDGQAFECEANHALVSVGRAPNTRGLGLEAIGILCERDAVVTDERMKTNVPGVFAAGDINGRSMLAHTAYREAEVAVGTMLGKKDCMTYDAIPSVIYTNPEAAGVGETTESARAKGMDVTEKTMPMRYSGRFLAENEGGDGICKLVQAPDGAIVGVHMLGNPASEVIAAAAVAIDRKMDAEALKKVVFPHPSVSEIMKEILY